MKRHLWKLMLLAMLSCTCSVSAVAQTAKRSTGPKIVIKELQLDGITTLDTTEVNDIRNSLLELRMNDDRKEFEQRLRNAFQERGYFDAEVTSVNIKALDPLATPKPVRVEAVVSEGSRFVVERLIFAGYSALSPDELRAAFPIQIGDFGKYSEGSGRPREVDPAL